MVYPANPIRRKGLTEGSLSLSEAYKKMFGYLGPEGSFTHEALLRFLQKSKNKHLKAVSFKTIKELVNAVSRKKIQLGIAPFKNSNTGLVKETNAYLSKNKKLKITHKITIPIKHCLVSNEKNLDKIKRIFSHPQAFSQCKQFLKKYLPKAVLMPTSSTSVAVKKISKTNKSIAAIGSQAASKIYNVPIVKFGINDKKKNKTLFVVIEAVTD